MSDSHDDAPSIAHTRGEAPSEALNRILWHESRGWHVPYPAVRQSLFFPMSRDLADDEREEKPRAGGAKRDR